MGIFDIGVDDELVMEDGGFAFEDEDVSADVDPDEGAADAEAPSDDAEVADDEGDVEDGDDEADGDEDAVTGDALAEEADMFFEDDDMVEAEAPQTGDTESTVGGDGLEDKMNPAADVVDDNGSATIANPSDGPVDAPAPENFDADEEVNPAEVEANND